MARERRTGTPPELEFLLQLVDDILEKRIVTLIARNQTADEILAQLLEDEPDD